MENIPSSPIAERPIKFSGALKDFEAGVLCFVVARRYQGKGPVRLILHVAKSEHFSFGAFGHYLVSPGTLAAFAKTEKKTAAARANGKKGGRPKKAVDSWD